jgi:hypothetical protein
MILSDAAFKRLTELWTKKIGATRTCSVCGTNKWNFSGGFINLTLSKNPKSTLLGGPGLPLVPLSCANCGNTHFLNLLILGVTQEELDSLQAIDEPDAKSS